MNTKQIVLSLVLVCFATLTGWALAAQEFTNSPLEFFEIPWAVQVSVDLVIALTLFVVWMWRDARQRGLHPTLYLVLILCLGSMGALIYLIRREARPLSVRLQPELATQPG